MAGHNMVNAVQGHLLHQQRPLYLQPVDEQGRYPWMASEDVEEIGQQIEDTSTSSTSFNAVSNTSTTENNTGAGSSNSGKRGNHEDGLSGIVWGAMDVAMDQAPEPVDSNSSFNVDSNTSTLENDQGSARTAHKRLASDEVDQIKAILRKALRYEE